MIKLARIIFIIGVFTTCYGYVSRFANIYFFWDSREIGWLILVVSWLLYLCAKVNLQDLYSKRTIRNLFGILFLLFFLSLSVFIISDIKSSNTYQVAVEYLKNDNKIKNLVGEIERLGLIPMGTVNTRTVDGVETGSGVLHMTINGSKRNLDLTISLKSTDETGWKVVAVE